MSDEASSAAGQNVGALLVQARRRLNLEVADVAAQLRLSPVQIEALEGNRFDRLPGGTFVRGVIRSYAKLLQIDPALVLAAYEVVAPRREPNSIEVPNQNIRFASHGGTQHRSTLRWGIGVVVVMLAAAGIWLSGKPKPPQAALKLDKRPAAAPFAAAPPASSSMPLASQANPSDGSAATHLTVPVPVPALAIGAIGAASGRATAPSSTPAANVPQPVAGAVAVSRGEGVIQFVFAGDSWVEVRDGAGKVIFTQLNPAGSEQQVTGTPPFSLVVGNAAAVRMTYNNAPYDLAPHVKISVARLTLE